MHRPSSNQKLAVFLDQLPSTAALVLLDQVLQNLGERKRDKKKIYIYIRIKSILSIQERVSIRQACLPVECPLEQQPVIDVDVPFSYLFL